MRVFLKRHGWWLVVIALAGLGFRDWGIPLLIAFVWGMVQVGVLLRDRSKMKEANNAK